MLAVHSFADSHTHAYAPFDKGFHCYEKMASLGVTDVNLLAYTYIETGIDNNLVCLYYKAKSHALKLRVFGGLYYDKGINNDKMPYLEQAKLLLAMGCEGIKFLDMKPNYNLYCGCSMDDHVYDELYDYLEENQIPLVTHIADPANFWHRDQMSQWAIDYGWCYDDPKFLTQQQIFDCTIRRLEKNPALKMSLAHCGFMTKQPDLFCSMLDRFPNVTFDLAPGWEIFVDFSKDIDRWQEIFTHYNRRILYGTDTCTTQNDDRITALNRTMIETVSHDKTELPIPHHPAANMKGLDLDVTSQQNILNDNYFRHVGTDIKSIDKSLFLEHAALIRKIAANDHDSAMCDTIDFMTSTI